MTDIQEHLTFIRELSQKIKAQDNRGTAQPYFYVIMRERWRVCHDEFSTGETKMVRLDNSGDPREYEIKNEYDGPTPEFIDAMADYFDSVEETRDAWWRLPTYTLEKYTEEENVFLTEEGYKQHLALNEHNYRQPYYSYVKHAFRNPEMAKLIEAIHAIAEAK